MKEEKCWKEDYYLENGKYYNTCLICKESFIGHKIRRVCRECQEYQLDSADLNSLQ